MIQKVDLIIENGENTIIQGINEIKGRNIIFTSEKTVDTVLKKRNPIIETVTIEKVLPQMIRIVVHVFQPVAYYEISPARFILFASDGSVLGYTYEKPDNLGKILYHQPITKTDFVMGSPIRLRAIVFAAQLASVYQKSGLNDFRIDVQDTHLVVSELGNAIIKADSEANSARQLSAINRILYILKRGGEKVRIIDVRFEKLIIEQ